MEKTHPPQKCHDGVRSGCENLKVSNCHIQNVKEKNPPTQKRHNDVSCGNLGMDSTISHLVQYFDVDPLGT